MGRADREAPQTAQLSTTSWQRRPAALASFVDHLWFGADSSRGHTVIRPDGCVDVVFVLGPSASRILVFGSTLQATRFPLEPSAQYLGVRFRPGRFGPFLGDRVARLTATSECWAEFLGLRASQLSDAKATTLEAALLRNAPRFRPLPAVQRAVELIERSRGSAKIEAMASEIGVTRRHLERRFVEHVGVSPKRLARIVRFQHASRLLEAGHHPLDVVTELGYADQSHLCRELSSLGR